MKQRILISFLLMTMAACGPGGPDSAGPITTPSPDTTTSVPDSTTTTSTVPTTDTSLPSHPGSTTTTVPAPSTSTTTPSPGGGSTASSITVYLLDQNGSARAVQRSVTTNEVARAAIQALITGPTSGEIAADLSTAVPADTLILGLRIDGGTAVVDLSREFEAGAGSLSILGRLAQVVYSLTEFGSVERVRLLIDGEAVDVFSSEGVVLGQTVTRRDFTGAIPIGAPVVGGSASTWAQNDLPAVTLGSPDTYRVVLVAGDDVLNVRDTPGVGGAIIGRLEPGVAVRAAGQTRDVGTSRWLTIETPAGPGWVNGFYLTRSVATSGFPGGGDPLMVVRQLADRMAAGEDITPLVSAKGLWVSHHAPPVRFPRGELAGILTDATTYRWGSKALEQGSPEIRPRTFAEAVADRLAGAYHDGDSRVVVNEIIEGPNGRPAALAIPTEFGGFSFVTVHDPGDDPQYEGLDWTGWIVSLAFEDGQIKVVGLTLDEWAP
ncbi:hypothetical protein BH23ACT5_BH23ACT5_20740 [soil metagenome]